MKRIIKSTAIFDGVRQEPYEGFVVIDQDKIAAVIDGKDISAYGNDYEVIDMGDSLVMPGFHDSHVHFLAAGMYFSSANLLDCKSEEECAKKLYDFEKDRGGDGWVYGFSWYQVYWDDPKLPTKKSLDKYFPDRPVLLNDAEGHACWVNSKALEIAGVTKDTPDPEGGRIFRDENGEPTGYLSENAYSLVAKNALYEMPIEEQIKYSKIYMDVATKYGYTSVDDKKPTGGYPIGSLETLRGLEEKGELDVRVHVAMSLLGDIDETVRLGKEYETDCIKVKALKQFLDGVVATHTALMVDDYADEPGNNGTFDADFEANKKAVLEAHDKGLSVYLHCCGDKAVRLALDYFEAAIEKYGKKENVRHSVEHLEVVHPDDLERFSKLGVIASVQPEHMALTQTYKDNPYPIVLGEERTKTIWPLKDLLNTGAVLAFGTDCPVVNCNPLLEVYRGVTRVHNDGEPKGGWLPEQKLTMYEALRAYTYGSAYKVCREEELGTLEAGKFADITVLDKNLFTIPEEEILSCKVRMTMMGGRITYQG